MNWLNYHHLYYFSVIAREGGVAAAARKLHLTHSTLSAQLRALEEHFGAPLFERRGKRLVLTPFGAEAASYAADIFRLGRELNDVARGKAVLRREVFRVGAVAAIPKTLVRHLLAPALDKLDKRSLLIRQDTTQNLVEALALGRLHVALTIETPGKVSSLPIHAHPLGETDIMLYARSDLARKARRNFPASLSGLPLLLPPSDSPLRQRLDEWLTAHDVETVVRAEVEDAGLLRALGGAGLGVFPVRAALRGEAEDLSRVELVGRCDGVHERYYALTGARRIRHPSVAAIVDRARADLHKARGTRTRR